MLVEMTLIAALLPAQQGWVLSSPKSQLAIRTEVCYESGRDM